jgi:hypothetical protein
MQDGVYIRQPRGAEDGTPHVMRLLKSIYVMKQALREWYKLLHHARSLLPWTQASNIRHEPLHHEATCDEYYDARVHCMTLYMYSL